MKILLAALAVFFAGPALAIDLDRPGALEALKRENPAHFAKIDYTKVIRIDAPASAMPAK